MKKTVTLPGEWEGRKLVFYEASEEQNTAIFPLLGGACGLLIWRLAEERERRKEKRRKEALLKAYPEVVMKAAILFQTGLPARTVWERLAEGYRRERKNGGTRPICEEILRTETELSGGASECEAYQDFGRRLSLPCYRKFASMLEQSVRTGSHGLPELLFGEVKDAWDEQKRHARKRGEEAGVRLLGPMFLLLTVSMLLIMLPALGKMHI